jgi:predicted ATP-dependent Lon-type protease
MKCAEGTQTEEGSKWLKKHKGRNEVRERNSLKEKIKEDKTAKMIDHGQVSKQKRTLMGALENLMEKKKEQVDEVLKMRVMWTQGFWHMGFGPWFSKSHGMYK